MGSVSQSTRGVFFWLLLLCVAVDVHTAVVVTATRHRFRPMFAGTRSVSQSTAVCFFCLLLVCVSAVTVVYHTYCCNCSSHCCITVFGPCSRAHDRCHNRPRCVFCLLLVCVSAVEYHTYCCSSHCYITVFGPCSRAHDRCHNRPQCVFLLPPRV